MNEAKPPELENMASATKLLTQDAALGKIDMLSSIAEKNAVSAEETAATMQLGENIDSIRERVKNVKDVVNKVEGVLEFFIFKGQTSCP